MVYSIRSSLDNECLQIPQFSAKLRSSLNSTYHSRRYCNLSFVQPDVRLSSFLRIYSLYWRCQSLTFFAAAASGPLGGRLPFQTGAGSNVYGPGVDSRELDPGPGDWALIGGSEVLLGCVSRVLLGCRPPCGFGILCGCEVPCG